MADGGAAIGIVSWAPLLVAGGGLTVAFVTGFARRDQRVVSQETTLDARTNTAIKALTEALDRSEEERERMQKERNECLERGMADRAQMKMYQERAVAAEDLVATLQAQVAQLRHSIRTHPSRPGD